MRAELDDRLFARPADTPGLLSIFMLGFLERHRVVLYPPGAEYPIWHATLDALSKDLCNQVLNWSLHEEGLGPAHHAVRVVRSATPNQSPPELTLDDALDILHRPYRLLVENAHSDGVFVFCMATPDERRFLEERVRREWLEIETCGGITGVTRRVKTLKRRHRDGLRLRCSAMFDCDAPVQGSPSDHAKTAEQACGPTIHHHMLKRRAIENYLPLPTLERWCGEKKGKEERDRKAKMRAFSRLQPVQRHHFHMKDGLKKDNKPGAPASALSAALNDRDRGKLRDGFGPRIAELFESDVHEDELKRDGGWHELRPFIEGLIARIR